MAQDKPTPPAINLDSLEREGGVKDPFVFVLAGKRLEMLDMTDLGWQTVIEATENPRALMRLIVREKDQEQFFAQDLPSWKLNALMNSYFEHYGVDPNRPAASLR